MLNLIFPLMVSIMYSTVVNAGGFSMESVTKIQKEIRPLNGQNSMEYSEPVQEYFQYYGLDTEKDNTEHTFGTFPSGNNALAAHIFKPDEYKATVILVHGYLNHSGQLRHIIKRLLNEGYSVAVFDLPGHGLSTGKRAAINDFTEYTDSLIDFYEIVSTRLHGPYHLIGFSTGAAVALDYLSANQDSGFDKVILAAPLVRNWSWIPSRIGFWIYRPFTDSLPRKLRKNSSDKEFLDFSWNRDYLHADEVPIEWVNALYKWNEKIEAAAPIERKITVIQGSKDTTVDFRYNMKFIDRKCSAADIHLIKNARHELFNESPKLRNNALALTISCLEN